MKTLWVRFDVNTDSTEEATELILAGLYDSVWDERIEQPEEGPKIVEFPKPYIYDVKK